MRSRPHSSGTHPRPTRWPPVCPEETLRSWPTLATPTLAKPTLASVSALVVWPTLAKTDFGQTFDLCLCVVVCCCVLLCSVQCAVCSVAVCKSAMSAVYCAVCSVVGPRGLHTTTRELQTCTFERPDAQKHHQNSTRRPQKSRQNRRFKHHQHSTRRPPEREEKNDFSGRGKKARNLGLPPFGAPLFGAPPFLLHPSGPHSSGTHPRPTRWPPEGPGDTRETP